MPVITIETVDGVVLTSDEQRRELMRKMTDTFISVVGEVARPYTYCIILETKHMSLAGRALPDLEFLYGPEYAAMHAKSNEIMRNYVAQQAAQSPDNGKTSQAQKIWEGE